MKKALYILVIGSFIAGASLSFSAPAGKQAAYKGSNPSTFAQKKHCQRCKQGADGKMECVTVPCP